jgi:hypothetical protein
MIVSELMLLSIMKLERHLGQLVKLNSTRTK